MITNWNKFNTHLKKINEIWAFGNESHENGIKIIRKLGIEDFKIGNDHLGNEFCILFNYNDIDFEVYGLDSKSSSYNISYKKSDNDWISLKTMDLMKSINDILS